MGTDGPVILPGSTLGRSHVVMAFGGAVAVSVILFFVPFGRYVLYPFSMLCTWAHEMGHGLAAMVLGGRFDRLELYPNLGGVAYYRSVSRGLQPIVAAAGLLGPAIAGGAIIVLGARSRMAGWILISLTGGLALSALLYVRNVFGLIFIILVAIGLALVSTKTPVMVRLATVQFLGIQFCLGALSDFNYMFTKSFQRGGQILHSDTQSIAEVWWLPYWFWGAVIAALNVVILVGAFYGAWLSPGSAKANP